MENLTDPIAADELLYRRVPVSMNWYDPDSGVLEPQAFDPHRKNDVTGISVFRKKHKSLIEAARGQPGKSYYVAVLCARDLQANRIRVVPRPRLNDPGHAELPDLNTENRKSDEALELQRVLVELSRRVEGPFASAVP